MTDDDKVDMNVKNIDNSGNNIKVFKKIREILKVREEVREELIKLSRELRILSSKAIARIHARRFDDAERYIEEALKVFEKIKEYKNDFPSLMYIANDAMQEFVEALVFKSSVESFNINIELPDGIEEASILTGYADSIGELRRYILDLLKSGKEDDIAKAEKLVELMDEIYFNLIEFDFPDKLTGNLRIKLDIARQSIERTKSDLISVLVAEKIDDKLKNLGTKIK